MNDVDESYLWTNECWRKDTATKTIGNFDVQVFAVNGDTDEEKLVRTYRMEVRTVNRVLSGQEPGNGPPHYYIPRHGEAPVSFMFLRPSGYISSRTEGQRQFVFQFVHRGHGDSGRRQPVGQTARARSDIARILLRATLDISRRKSDGGKSPEKREPVSGAVNDGEMKVRRAVASARLQGALLDTLARYRS